MNDSDDKNLNNTDDQAVNMVRAKIAGMFNGEPDQSVEKAEIKAETKLGIELSRHQLFLKHLYDSGRTTEEIKSAWHNYYQNLSDADKIEVWREYNERSKLAQSEPEKPSPQTLASSSNVIQPVENLRTQNWQQHTVANEAYGHQNKKHLKHKWREKEVERDEHGRFVTRKTVKQHLVSSIEKARLAQSHPVASKIMMHLRALSFALAVGGAFMFIMFNQILIGNVRAWMSPGTTYAGPIIKDRTDIAVSPDPRVVIPSIATDVPVVYEEYDVRVEAEHQKRLEKGVVHIPGTAVPGQNGNVVIIGHSANNFFNQGDYKFAFVWLRKVEIGDTFQLNYGGKLYIYSVYDKKVVNPSETGVIYGPTKEPFTVTLITCDPPGNNSNRLVVQGKQVYPEADTKQAVVTNSQTKGSTVLPSNPKSLWSKIFN